MIYSKKVCQECKKILTFMHIHMASASSPLSHQPSLVTVKRFKKTKRGTPSLRDPMLNSRGGRKHACTHSYFLFRQKDLILVRAIAVGRDKLSRPHAPLLVH